MSKGYTRGDAEAGRQRVEPRKEGDDGQIEPGGADPLCMHLAHIPLNILDTSLAVCTTYSLPLSEGKKLRSL